MFVILLIIDYGLGNDNPDFTSIKRFFYEPKRLLIKCKSKNNDYDKQKLYSFNKRHCACKHTSTLTDASLNKKIQSVNMQNISKFMDEMKKYNLKNSDILGNIDYYNRRIKCFDSLLRQWENENFNIAMTPEKVVFSNTNNHKKFMSDKIIHNRWMRNYNDLLKVYLPLIKNGIKNSSISQISKKTITKKIDSIMRAMSYFENLEPKNLRFDCYSNVVIFRYNLISYRFPYLFDYFDLSGRFVNLYEMIIIHDIDKEFNSINMINILSGISKKIEKLIKTRDEYINSIREMLKYLENLKNMKQVSLEYFEK
ncbi:uncharacterized protein VNE69_02034 [Vairimorpha necatrix]|uniref:Uncharacterized protein n=1 Tax=Vairimorpha necatrix TaxID=6039 RepID=A0AAX4J9D8_9MICR